MKPALALLMFSAATWLCLQACTPQILLWPTGKKAEPQASADSLTTVVAFCQQNKGTYISRTNAQGNQVYYCLFTDQSYCEAFDYYRGACTQGSKPSSEIL